MSKDTNQRPLSPHLQIYKPQITSVLSITHRATGVALWAGSLLLVGWLWALAYDGDYYACLQEMAAHPLAKILLIGWTFALNYHLANGIRHLFWDAGRGFELCNVSKSGILVVLFALTATASVWCWLIRQYGF